MKNTQSCYKLITILILTNVSVCCTSFEDISHFSVEGAEKGELHFVPGDSVKTICIKCIDEWEIVGEETWLNLSRRNGKGGDSTTITAKAIPEFDKTDLNIIVGKERKVIHVYNNINGYLTVQTPDTLYFAKTELTDSFRIRNNPEWIVEYKPKWCTMPEFGEKSDFYKYLTITCTPYVLTDEIITDKDIEDKTKNRLDSIVLQLRGFPKIGEFRKVVFLSQGPTYYLGVKNNLLEIPLPINEDDANPSFKIESNIKWKVRPTDAKWLNIRMDSSDDLTEIKGPDSSDEVYRRDNVKFTITLNTDYRLSDIKHDAILTFYSNNSPITLRDFDIHVKPIR